MRKDCSALRKNFRDSELLVAWGGTILAILELWCVEGGIARNPGRRSTFAVGCTLFLTHFKLEKSQRRNVSAEDRLEPDVPPGPERGGLGPTEFMTPQKTAGTVISRYHLLQKIGEGGMPSKKNPFGAAQPSN